MEKSKPRSQDVRAMTAENLEKARGAMQNYLDFFQKGMSAAPWATNDMNKKMVGYVRENMNAAFDFAQRLTNAEDLPQVMRIQSEFFQHQLKSLTDQAKDIGAAATQAVPGAAKDDSPSKS